ncbi:peptidoglycan/LPS O-acetylase OafA/YrhL [Actinoplanes tereljensis]|uniref:Acyltransferase n=1 Tax=Paractinoplanes tereljensis TaxID=571912 RepID=A0A919NI23_9ACTN|nr:acyltransferase family protein [Actinoplanes tereljensis]GIF18583.1 acyltransferase [Actinoplanes tereljensis]
MRYTALDTRPHPLPGQRDSLPASVLPGRSFRPDIEGLRAIAVLLVVAAHTGVPFLSGGYVGVDVFFVISGFLITSLLLREAEQTGRISVPRFYARRAMRLLPAAAVVLITTLVAARLFLPLTRLGEFCKDALAAAGYVANLRFAEAGTDYLRADQSPSPFQHFWSLAVEEQFYLVWPLLILLSAYLWKRRRPLVAVLAVVVVVSFTLSVTETARSAPWAYFGPHTRAWELGAGALLALAAGRIPRHPLLGWAGLAAILTAAVIFDDSTAYPGWLALLPVAGAVAMIAAASSGAGRLLGLAPMQAIGRLSYGWYLWHWPVLLIVPTSVWWQKALLAVGALGLAWITYRLVENPLRHRRWPMWQGAGFSAAVAAVALLLAFLPHDVEAGGRRADLRATLASAADPAAELARTIDASRKMGALPANLTPKLTKAARDRPRVWDIGCHADTPVTTAPEGCVFGDPNGRETVVLYGDSHAAQWFPAMEKLAIARHWRLVELTKSSCTAADLAVWHDTLKRAYTECLAFHRSALARIGRLKPARVVIGSSFNYRPAVPATDVAGQWRAAWDRTFAQLEARGARVSAIADTPYMGGPVPECLAEPANAGHAGNCTRSLRSALRGPEQREVFLAYAGRPRTTVINPITWFCTDVCPPVVGNLLVYRDSNHMTTTYSAALAPLLGAQLPQ